MGIGKRIKEAREALHLTQKELGAKVGVTGSSITNYENETSHPKEPIMYKLINELGVDANYLFQDEFKSTRKMPTPEDADIVFKYMQLNDEGKEYIDTQLDYALAQKKYTKKIDSGTVSNVG